VAQTCPTDIARDIQRRWQRRFDATTPVLKDDAGGGRCPKCNRSASIAPTSSEYRGQGIIHHRWSCRGCGHEWATVVHVPNMTAAKEI
jgi:hypothetical protein